MTCDCCKNRRVVPDLNGEMRPCSRCRVDAFSDWYRGRIPVRATEPSSDDQDALGARKGEG